MYFKEHRSGWNYAINLLSRHANENGVLLVEFVESIYYRRKRV